MRGNSLFRIEEKFILVDLEVYWVIYFIYWWIWWVYSLLPVRVYLRITNTRYFFQKCCRQCESTICLPLDKDGGLTFFQSPESGRINFLEFLCTSSIYRERREAFLLFFFLTAYLVRNAIPKDFLIPRLLPSIGCFKAEASHHEALTRPSLCTNEKYVWVERSAPFSRLGFFL